MNRRNVMLVAALALVAGLAFWSLGPIAQEHKTEAAETLQVSKLDSSSTWKTTIGGGCSGGKGFCCRGGFESHLQEVKNIKKFEVDKEKSLVTLTIEKGKEVQVKEIQEALGSHWTIKTIEKSEEKG